MKNQKVYEDMIAVYNNKDASSVEIRNALIQAIYTFLTDATFKHNYESINWFAHDVLGYKDLFSVRTKEFGYTNRLYLYIEYLSEIVTSEMNRYEMRIAINNFMNHLVKQFSHKKI